MNLKAQSYLQTMTLDPFMLPGTWNNVWNTVSAQLYLMSHIMKNSDISVIFYMINLLFTRNYQRETTVFALEGKYFVKLLRIENEPLKPCLIYQCYILDHVAGEKKCREKLGRGERREWEGRRWGILWDENVFPWSGLTFIWKSWSDGCRWASHGNLWRLFEMIILGVDWLGG